MVKRAKVRDVDEALLVDISSICYELHERENRATSRREIAGFLTTLTMMLQITLQTA